MKKIILSLLILFPLTLGSCSDEIAEISEEQVEDVTFSTSFDVAGVDTKGVTAADEKKVSGITVFVFRNAAAPNDTLVSKTDIAVTSMPVSSSIKAKSGSIKIVALANTGNITAKTYAKLQEQMINYSITNFVSASLPKFAVKDTTLAVTIEDGEQVVPKINMTLVQLAARVDILVGLDSNSKTTYEFAPKDIKVTGVNGSSYLVLGEYKQNEYTHNTAYKELSLTENYGNNSFYTFETNKSIRLEVSGKLKDKRTSVATDKRYGMDITPKFVSGGESKTDGFVHGYWYTVTGVISPANEMINIIVSVKPWGEKSVADVEFGGPNSDNNDRKEEESK